MKRSGTVAEDAVEVGARAEPAGNAERMPLIMRSVLAAHFKKGRNMKASLLKSFHPDHKTAVLPLQQLHQLFIPAEEGEHMT